MRTILILFLLIGVTFFLGGFAQLWLQPGQEKVITLAKTNFSPNELAIQVGTEVIFKNIDTVPHWPASNIHPTHEIYSEFDPKQEIKPGKSWSFKFSKSGTWYFHDHLFPSRTGMISVLPKPKTEALLTSSDNIVKMSFRWFFAYLIERFPQFAFFKPTKNLPYTYNAVITKTDQTLFLNIDSLFSYIKKFGIHETIQYLHTLGVKYGDCHQTAHLAGRIAYELEGASAFGKCGAQCHSGCYHGAIEAYFKEHGTGNLKESFSAICDPTLNPFFLHQCIHGIGHGLTAWSNYDIPKTLAYCDELPSYQASCHSGVFMENIVGGLSGGVGHTSKYLSDDPHFPCTVVEEKYKGACYFYQTSRMLMLYNGDFAKVASACAAISPFYQSGCFSSMGRDIGGVYRTNPEGAIAACKFVSDEIMQIHCLTGAAQDTFWDPSGADTAITFCSKLTKFDEKKSCYDTIWGRAKEVLSSNDQPRFCQKFEPDFQFTCVKG